MRPLGIALVVLALAQPVVGQTWTWDGGGTNDNWTTAANWNPTGAPKQAVGQSLTVLASGETVDWKDADAMLAGTGAAFAQGTKGGASIYANTMTMGATDYFAITQTEQYQGGAYDASRVASAISREAAYTLVTMGTTHLARGGYASAKVASSALNYYDAASSGYDVYLGFECVRQGDRSGFVQMGLGATGLSGSLPRALHDTRLIESRLSGRTSIVQRWMSQAELDSTMRTGMMRGGRSKTHFVTPTHIRERNKARMLLALQQTPDVRAWLEVPEWRLTRPTRIPADFGMPGGALQQTSWGQLPVVIIGYQHALK